MAATMVDEDRLGVLAGCFLPGAGCVDMPALAKHSGVPPPRGLIEKRVTDIDETEVTLALDVMGRVLHDCAVTPDELAGLFVASGDADETASWLAKVLQQDDLDVQTFSSTSEAAGGAIMAAVASAKSRHAPVLFIGAQGTTSISRDAPDPGQIHKGAGATALVMGPGASTVFLAHRVRHHLHGPPPPLALILEGLHDDGDAGSGSRVTVAAASPGGRDQLLRGLEKHRLAPFPVERLGDLGAAAPPAALLEALALSEPGDRVDLVVPGRGRSMALGFLVQEVPRVFPPSKALEQGGLSMEAGVAHRVQRAWSEHGEAEPRGAYVPLPVFHAQDPARLRLQGQKCLACGRLLFPPRQRCPGCAMDRFEPHAFTGEGTVHALTRISKGGAPAEFAALQEARGAYGVAIVELKEGPRVAAMLTGPRMDGEGVRIGDGVRLVVRLVYVQEGVPRYSFKALVQPGAR